MAAEAAEEGEAAPAAPAGTERLPVVTWAEFEREFAPLCGLPASGSPIFNRAAWEVHRCGTINRNSQIAMPGGGSRGVVVLHPEWL